MDDRATKLYTNDSSETEQASHGVSLIGTALGLGAAEPGCSDGPDILQGYHPELLMLGDDNQVVWQTILRLGRHQPDNVIATIAMFCQTLAELIQKTINNKQRFITIGGDHACAIGTWSGASLALADKGPLGLVWIDAHLDAHTPETSPSGYVHGMPLACLLGHGYPLLTNLIQTGPKLSPQHVCVIGVRHYEQEELDLLNRLGVRVIFMEEVHRYGFDAAFQKAVTIASTGTAGFGISIDLDAIDPADAPAVGTPVEEGIHATALIDSIASLNSKQNLIGYEIAEFNPKLDVKGRTARLICDLLVATVSG